MPKVATYTDHVSNFLPYYSLSFGGYLFDRGRDIVSFLLYLIKSIIENKITVYDNEDYIRTYIRDRQSTRNAP